MLAYITVTAVDLDVLSDPLPGTPITPSPFPVRDMIYTMLTLLQCLPHSHWQTHCYPSLDWISIITEVSRRTQGELQPQTSWLTIPLRYIVQ